MYRSRAEFLDDIRKQEAETLLRQWLNTTAIPFALGSLDRLQEFLQPIRADWESTELLMISGTGAWRFSLNPDKNFKEFSERSDIDVVNVSYGHFCEAWDRLRFYHRRRWYIIGKEERSRLLRNGQDIYSGFVSPKWIPDKQDRLRFRFLTGLERYSTDVVRFRSVNMLFFKNLEEAHDYYRRGIEIAKSKLS